MPLSPWILALPFVAAHAAGSSAEPFPDAALVERLADLRLGPRLPLARPGRRPSHPARECRFQDPLEGGRSSSLPGVPRRLPEARPAAGGTPSAAPVLVRGEFELRVLTYNIWGIPMDDEKSIGRHDRYREIGRILAALRREGRAPHVVAVQEAFHPRTAELAREAGYPFVQAGSQVRRGKLLPSGLVILSEFPLEDPRTFDYRDCVGWDCWANKGLLSVRVRVPGLPGPALVLTTHMNADWDGPTPPPEEVLRVRMSQIEQASAFLKEVRDGLPVIFAGDFNFRPGGADYAAFGEATGLANAGERCAASPCPGGAPRSAWSESVDHHYFAPGNGADMTPVRFEQTFRDPVDGRPLSDHAGLEARYRVAW